MHEQLEIILPPVDDLEKAVKEIMEPFNENNYENDACFSGHPFWDFYVIGGRFAGEKFRQSLDQEKLEAFNDELEENKVTVSGIQCGKQELQPSNQIPMVDALWSKHFPEYVGKACPLFAHSNNQYDSNDCLCGDITPLSLITDNISAHRVIFAGLRFNSEKYAAKYMLSRSVWNGVNDLNTHWSGKIVDAVAMLKQHIDHYSDEYKASLAVDDDWLCVTVDYHS